MNEEQTRALRSFFGFTDSDWQMSPSERLAIVGLLAVLKPATTLEIGHRLGGCTRWFSEYSGHVWTVDVDPYVLESSKRFSNVTPMHMTSTEAMKKLSKEGKRFEVALIDGDHSTEVAGSDLKQAMELCDVIVLHDAANPECRRGYKRALENSNVVADLDWIDGRLQPDGLWGGLGIVLTTLPPGLERVITPALITNADLAAAEQVRRRLPVWRRKMGDRLMGRRGEG
jgi:predicted O-methyltransferase YrrM